MARGTAAARFSIPLLISTFLYHTALSLSTPPPHTSLDTAAEQVASAWPCDPYISTGATTGYSLGNHYVAVAVDGSKVPNNTTTIQVEVLWRRRTTPPLNHTAVIAALPPACDGCNVTLLPNVVLLPGSTLHSAAIAVQLPKGCSSFHLYYMPYTFSGGSGGYASKFTAALPASLPSPDLDWLAQTTARYRTSKLSATAGSGHVTGFYSRTDFDKFTVTERVASAAEVASYVQTAGSPPLFAITELRQNSVRSAHALPITWLLRSNQSSVRDDAQPDEFYTFQVALYNTAAASAHGSGSAGGAGSAATIVGYKSDIGAASQGSILNCFNLEGARFNGTRFKQTQQVNASTVATLWFGIDVGAAQNDGAITTVDESGKRTIRFNLTILATYGESRGTPWQTTVAVELNVIGSVIPSKGDRDSWRLARLRWLDSTDGRDDNVSAAFVPIQVHINKASMETQTPISPPHQQQPQQQEPQQTLFSVDVLSRRLTVDAATGLPVSIQSNGIELLAGPMQFVATTDAGIATTCKATAGNTLAKPIQFGEGRVSWAVIAKCTEDGVEIKMTATLTYEGYLNVGATVVNTGPVAVTLNDLELVAPLKKVQAVFGMGIGMISGYRPQTDLKWKWQDYGTYYTGPTDPRGSRGDIVPQVWLGTPEAGLRIALKGEDPEWDSPEDYPKVPTASSFANCVANTNSSLHAVCAGTISLQMSKSHGHGAYGGADGEADGGAGDGADGADGISDDGVVYYSASLGRLTVLPSSVNVGKHTVTPKSNSSSISSSNDKSDGSGDGINQYQEIPLRFDILATPLKPVNLSQHFTTKYYHFGDQMPQPNSNLSLRESVSQIKELGVTWIVIHQGSNLNPYINYPLNAELMGVPSLQTFVDMCHDAGINVKLYFTTRELSNRCSEMFALKALPNHEVLYGDGSDGTNGEGGGGQGDGGGAWLQEHLGGDYKVAWSTVGYPWLNGMKGVRADEAIADNGASRWDNYYVEANTYLLDTPGTDGLYLDAIAFDRTTMERIRKKMERKKTEIRMDIHRSGGWYCHGPGFGTPVLRYMQHFAWTDSLWMGEGFDYWGSTPEWWLLETSGLPFGMTGDMIREGAVGANGTRNRDICPDPNRWLGMVFGMAARLGFGTPLGANVRSAPNVQEVVPMWQFWNDYGLANSTMIGWWDGNNPVHVSTASSDGGVHGGEGSHGSYGGGVGDGTNNVKATVYVTKAKGKMIVALGNFGNETTSVHLAFDHSGGRGTVAVGAAGAAGKRPMTAPAIEAFQPATLFTAGETVTIEAKRGWLLVVDIN